MGYFIRRINHSADNDETIIGRRLKCGKTAEPFNSKRSAESTLKIQQKQDMELCPECVIFYSIIEQ